MFKPFLACLLFLLSFNFYAQDLFKPGYFINNQGVKTTGLIKDKDKFDTPNKIEYKLTENSDSRVATLETVKELMIGENYKLQRFTVNIDKARQDATNLTSSRNPSFVEEQLFLNVLVEGNATLYSHRRNGEELFFYSINGSEVEQLVYRVYNLGDNKIRHNSFYKQQLFTDLKCESINLPQIDRTDYRVNALANLFVKYNECVNSPSVVYKEEKKSGAFNLTIRPGVNFNNLHISKGGYYTYNTYTERQEYVEPITIFEEYDFKPSFRIGLELEYIFPFFNNKWGVTLEPTFTNYETDAPLFLPGGRGIPPNPIRPGVRPESVNIQYSTIELPFAVRYYIFLNNDSRIFINGGAAYNYHFNSKALETFEGGLTRERNDFVFSENDFAVSFFGGFGYNYNNRWSIEGRYYPLKSISRNGEFKLDNNHGITLMVGYRLF